MIFKFLKGFKNAFDKKIQHMNKSQLKGKMVYGTN